jgi:hypothetical protein
MLLGGTASFVQATILDTVTGAFSTYTPLVLDATAPFNVAAIAPTVPVLPANNIVAIYGGTNGGSATLEGVMNPDTISGNPVSSFEQGKCVNGGGASFSIFGQFFCCNCREFMDEVYNLIRAGVITEGPAVGAAANQVPALGVDAQGNACPTTHSFAIVDQDQSDNVPAKYLFIPTNAAASTGTLAQDTVTNKATLTNTKTAFIEFDNGSDEDLITLVQTAIACHPWVVQDLADPAGTTFFATALTNELQALALQAMPRAFVPANDPMVMALNTAGGTPVIDNSKLNAYRAAVGQASVGNVAEGSTQIYCNNLYAVGAPAIATWLPILVQWPAPDFGLGVSNTLGGLLVGRYGATVGAGNLNCPALLGVANPFSQFTFTAANANVTLGNTHMVVPSFALVCPPPFSATGCVFQSVNGGTLQQALGITGMVADNTGQATFDIPFAPASPVFV